MRDNLLMNVICWAYLLACPTVLIWMAYTLNSEPTLPSRLADARLNHLSPAE